MESGGLIVLDCWSSGKIASNLPSLTGQHFQECHPGVSEDNQVVVVAQGSYYEQTLIVKLLPAST